MKSKDRGISQNLITGAVQLNVFNNLEEELNALAIKIGSFTKSERGNTILIARTRKLLDDALKVLKENSIEAEIVNKNQEFTSPLILLVYYCLKLLNSPDSRSILNKLCSIATMLNGITLSAEEIAGRASVGDNSLLRTFFEDASKSQLLEPVCKLGLEQLCNSQQYSTFILKSFDYFDTLENIETDEEFKSDKENWIRISSNLKSIQGNNVTLHILLQEMDLTPKIKSLSKNCVRLQTVHTAKGLEFDTVFVIGLAEDQFPTYYSIKNGIESIEEERRSCFVAVTRASKSLYLSYARKYNGWDKKPSRFLQEMELL